MNSNKLKTLLAIGALTFSCGAAQAQQLGSTPRLALVSTLLSNIGQPLNLGAVGLLGAGALSSNLNGLLSGGNRGANTSTTTLPGLGGIGAISINLNVLNGNTGLLRNGNIAGTP